MSYWNILVKPINITSYKMYVTTLADQPDKEIHLFHTMSLIWNRTASG